MTSSEQPLIVLVGPTAAGKTETAILLAERLGAEIVSADSRLLYVGMDIGTAKPGLAERTRVRHHLVDVTPPDKTWSLAVYKSMVHQVVSQIHARNRIPLLVGGTGQYIRSVLEGWQVPIVQPNQLLRNALEKWSDEITPLGLHQRLATLDPLAASQIDPRNLRRTIRALEVILTTGEMFSIQKKRHPSPYHSLVLGLYRPRQELYTRIDARIEAMFQAGFVAEVKGLLNQGYSPKLPPLTAIGYREVIAYLAGSISLDEAIAQMKRQTRIFVRRQANWFKLDDPEIHWFHAGSEVVDKMEIKVKLWLISDRLP